VTATALAERPAATPVVVPSIDVPGRDKRLDLAVRVAWLVFGLQLVGMVLWSTLLYNRWGATWDYAIRYQAWWGIAHGHLDPYVSVVNRYFWQDHFELIDWPLAPLSRLWGGGLWPLWIQDLMVFGGEIGALYLVVDAVRRPNWPSRLIPWVSVALVTLLLVANPWIYDSISFDFHYQSVGAACFAMLACREMIRGRTGRLALWVGLCLACGDIAGTYLAAVGIGGILAGRASRRRGAALLAVGAWWFVLVSLLGGGQGSSFVKHYGYLGGSSGTGHLGVGGLARGFLLHPLRVVGQLWQARADLWAYAVSSGGLGLFSPLAALPVLVLFESGSGQGTSLRSIAYENFGVLLFTAPLTVLVLASITRQLWHGWVATHLPRAGTRWLRSPRLPLALAAVIAVNALVWAAVWIPQVPVQWLRTPPATASALDRVDSMIPPDAEVVASQGVVGRLADRQWLYDVAGGIAGFPLHTPDTYFVLVPYAGIETASVELQLSMIGQLAGPLHATLLSSAGGVWLFRLPRTGGADTVTFSPSPTEPAWTVQTSTGRRLLDGPSYTWNMAVDGSRPGYVTFGANWNLLPGTYRTTVTMDTSVPTEVETWDSTKNVLLGRTDVPATNGQVAVQSVVRVTDRGGDVPFSGWGPFGFLPGGTPGSADRVELRVWTPGTGPVNVYTLEMQPDPG